MFLHEVAHIEGCHLDLIYDEMRLSEYQEININPLNEKESLLLRALELEADTLGLLNSLTLTLQKIRLFGELTQLSKPPGNATVPPGPLDWLTY